MQHLTVWLLFFVAARYRAMLETRESDKLYIRLVGQQSLSHHYGIKFVSCASTTFYKILLFIVAHNSFDPEKAINWPGDRDTLQ